MQVYTQGAYAELGKSIVQDPRAAANVPVYFGRLPIHLATGGTENKVNFPIIIKSWPDALRKVGYSNDWTNFDQCEAIFAHFRNDIDPVGPIVVINVFDPETMKKDTPATQALVLTGGKAAWEDDLCLPNSIQLLAEDGETIDENKKLGTDYLVSYDAEQGIFTFRDATGTLGPSVKISYTQVDPEAVTAPDVIGQIDVDDRCTGIKAVELVYQELNVIPSLLCAPGWSDNKAVRAALISASQQINKHWYAFVNTDIPITDATKNIDGAIKWKQQNGYTSENEAPCWPMAKKGDKIFHISTLATVTMMQVDAQNGGVPYETPSNKSVDVTSFYIDGSVMPNLGQPQVNRLSEVGIRSLSRWGGRWVIWGGHTGAYTFGEDVDPRAIYDCSMRMLYYIINMFQVRHGPDVHKPMTRNEIQSLLTRTQEWLDGFVGSGALLYAAVTFSEDDNPREDIIQGVIKFDIRATTTPPLRSITGLVRYTDEGLGTLFFNNDEGSGTV